MPAMRNRGYTLPYDLRRVGGEAIKQAEFSSLRITRDDAVTGVGIRNNLPESVAGYRYRENISDTENTELEKRRILADKTWEQDHEGERIVKL